MKKSIGTKITGAEVAEIVGKAISKSAKVRELFDGGLEIKEISAALEIRYNFAFNVLQNYININDIEVEKSVRSSKRDEIVVLLQSGMSLADISKQTKTNYNYIWKINKELKGDATTEEPKEEIQVPAKKTTKKTSKNGPVVTYSIDQLAK
jgi:hypothetical protein